MEENREEIGVTEKFYQRQNRVVHRARDMLGMSLEECRVIAGQICGRESLRCLSIRQRWELIEALKSKGARIFNPPLTESGLPKEALLQTCQREDNKRTSSIQLSRLVLLAVEDIYPAYLAHWDKKFPKRRPGFASNKQLAWIQVLWELDFTESKGNDNGLRKFLYRQTMNLPQGPVSDLAFLKANHVEAVITPLKKKALSLQQQKRATG